MSASIDATTLGYLVGRYHDRDVLLFEVAPQMLPLVDGEWTGPLALRLQREEGRMIEIEVYDLSLMFSVEHDTDSERS